MQFAHLEHGHGNKAGKFALVAGLHALVAVGIVDMMNGRDIALPSLRDDIIVLMTPPPVQPLLPPPDPPTALPKFVQPPILVPETEVDLPPPVVEHPLQTTTQPQPNVEPKPVQPDQAEKPAPTVLPATNRGAMRSAVLADASGCVKPDYPVSAARNGDSGTVTLALLVGTDGRVSNARVQKSSGSRDLDRAAVNALSLCQFKPAMHNGVPEAGWAQIAYVWTLD